MSPCARNRIFATEKELTAHGIERTAGQRARDRRVERIEPMQRTICAGGVHDVVVENDRISFSVDQIVVPVLVKASYFPNWKASGADGPYRAGPNLMVVVPTDTEVEVHYGRTLIDMLGYALTFLGLVGLAGLVVADHRRRNESTDPGAPDPASPESEPVGSVPVGSVASDSSAPDASVPVESSTQ